MRTEIEIKEELEYSIKEYNKIIKYYYRIETERKYIEYLKQKIDLLRWVLNENI